MAVLTEREQLIVDAVIEGIEAKIKHTCAFSPNERKIIHDIIDAVESEGADHETHIIVWRIGNNVRDFTKQVAKKAIWLLLTGLAAALYFILVHPWFRKM